MRKSFLAVLGVATLSMGAAATADAAVKTYWDQATGKWMKYDTNARRVSPLSPNSGNTTNMGKVTQARGSAIPRKTVDYDGPFHPNTIVVNTSERRLYYILDNGKALKYGVGVGREGFQWAGTNVISRKAEWPGWTPPPEMIAREKQKGRILPAYMDGGPNNPLGARALYIGGTLYRIHGSNEPWTMGQAVSSGCIRMTNDDISHLYDKVRIGTRVVVLSGNESKARLFALANPPPPEKESDVKIADARTKDDALISIGIGVAVAGTVPADAAEVPAEPTANLAPAGEPGIANATDIPEVRAKDEAIASAMPAADQSVASDGTAVVAVVAPAAPVDEAAKDDAMTIPAAADSAAETPEPAQPAEVDEDAASLETAPAAPAGAPEPVAKDDDLATDLGGGSVPINGEPKLGDATASTSPSIDPVSVAN